jgi:hypothetical protein
MNVKEKKKKGNKLSCAPQEKRLSHGSLSSYYCGYNGRKSIARSINFD